MTSCGHTCKECGKDISPRSPGGFCAECLMALGLEDGEEASGGRGEGQILPQPLTEGPGDRIGPYRLLQEIGHGGCGVVYMAEQQEPVRRRVALKVIKLGMDTRQVVARFQAERQALALMEHPNIAKVFHAGATDTGRPYFVMELVGGVKITDYCDQNHLATRQRLDLFVQVCRAVQHAHQKGIIHRDIKPANVLVATHDGVPVPKIIDFGIAKATQEPLTDRTLFTAFEQFMGTPAYMSPEQAELGGLDVDTRSDVYSLGVLLYELLTGTTPFDAKELQSAGLAAMRRTILEKDPPRPSTRLAQEMRDEEKGSTAQRQFADRPSHEGVRPRRFMEMKERIKLVRGDLDWIVMKCLEKDRGRRYETVNGLVLDLQRYLQNEPVRARPPTRVYQFQKFIRRNKRLVTSATAVGVVMLLGTVISNWQAIKARRAEHEQSRLREEAQRARQEATDKLWSSYLAEARASRRSDAAGRRFESLAAIRKAAALRRSLELRNEAIASMVLTDIRCLKEIDFSRRALVACDPELERYARSEPGGGITIRRVADDTELSRFAPVGSAVSGVWTFTPDGKRLGVFYKDGHLRLWDCASSTIFLETQSATAADFSPDSTRLVTLESTNLMVYKFSEPSSPRRIILKGFPLEVSSCHLLFHPSGRSVAVYSETETNLLLLDAASGETSLTLPHPNYLFRVAWHPDGVHLATTCSDNLVHIWDITTGRHVQSWTVDQAVSVAFNHRGTLLVSAGWDGKTRLWDFATGSQLVSIYKAGFLNFFSPDDRRVVSSDWDGTGLYFFEVASGQGLRTIYQTEKGPEGPGGTVVFSASGQLLAFSTTSGPKLWDVALGKELGSLQGEQMNPIGFDEQDKHLLVAEPQGLLLWPIKRSGPGERMAIEPPVHLKAQIPGTSGRISADGKTCALVGSNHCEVFDTEAFSHPVKTESQLGMRFIALSSDGSLLASGAWHYPGVVVWNARTGERLKELPTDESAIVAFNPDGRRLVISTKAEYRFVDVGAWSDVLRIPQQPGNDFPEIVAFSRDGKLFAGTHSRTVIRLFDADTGQVLADLESPNARMVTSLSFNADATALAVSEGLGTVRVWDLGIIRTQLGDLGLDWAAPPYPPQALARQSTSSASR